MRTGELPSPIEDLVKHYREVIPGKLPSEALDDAAKGTLGRAAEKTAARAPKRAFDVAPGRDLEGFKAAVNDLSVGITRGLWSLPEAAVGLADIVTAGAAGDKLKKAGLHPEATGRFIETLYSSSMRAASENVAASGGIADAETLGEAAAAVGETIQAVIDNPKVIARTLAEAVPLMLGGGLVGRALGAVPKIVGRMSGQMATAGSAGLRAAAGEAVVGAGSSAAGMRSATGEFGGKQALAASISGALTGVLGRGGAAAAKKLGIVDVDVMLAGGATSKMSRAARGGRARATAVGAIQEGLFEELAAERSRSRYRRTWRLAGRPSRALTRPPCSALSPAASWAAPSKASPRRLSRARRSGLSACGAGCRTSWLAPSRKRSSRIAAPGGDGRCQGNNSTANQSAPPVAPVPVPETKASETRNAETAVPETKPPAAETKPPKPETPVAETPPQPKPKPKPKAQPKPAPAPAVETKVDEQTTAPKAKAQPAAAVETPKAPVAAETPVKPKATAGRTVREQYERIAAKRRRTTERSAAEEAEVESLDSRRESLSQQQSDARQEIDDIQSQVEDATSQDERDELQLQVDQLEVESERISDEIGELDGRRTEVVKRASMWDRAQPKSTGTPSTIDPEKLAAAGKAAAGKAAKPLIPSDRIAVTPSPTAKRLKRDVAVPKPLVMQVEKALNRAHIVVSGRQRTKDGGMVVQGLTLDQVRLLDKADPELGVLAPAGCCFRRLADLPLVQDEARTRPVADLSPGDVRAAYQAAAYSRRLMTRTGQGEGVRPSLQRTRWPTMHADAKSRPSTCGFAAGLTAAIKQDCRGS